MHHWCYLPLLESLPQLDHLPVSPQRSRFARARRGFPPESARHDAPIARKKLSMSIPTLNAQAQTLQHSCSASTSIVWIVQSVTTFPSTRVSERHAVLALKVRCNVLSAVPLKILRHSTSVLRLIPNCGHRRENNSWLEWRFPLGIDFPRGSSAMIPAARPSLGQL